MTAQELTAMEQITVEAFGLTLDEQLDFDPQCESIVHDGNRFHSGDAAFLQLGPCEACTGLRCATFVR